MQAATAQRQMEDCAGFTISTLESETPALKSFSMPLGRYLQLLREGDVGDSTRIYITEIDKARLESLIAIEHGPVVVEIEHELERAIVVKPQQVSRNVVTMNSKALLRVDEEEIEVACRLARKH